MEIKTKPIKRKEFKHILFEDNLKDKDFRYCLFDSTGAKGITFENCDFSYATFSKAYFRKAIFINCKFIGAYFIDSNFRGVEMRACDFKYANFQNTVIPSDTVLDNLPEWPNVKRELLRIHRINASNFGDSESVKLYIREELTAQREHYRRARKRNESYYSNKYSGFYNWIKVRFKSILLWLDWNLWGHGEYPEKLIYSTLIILSVVALFISFKVTHVNEELAIGEFLLSIKNSIKYTFDAFLGIDSSNLYRISKFWTYFTVIFRITVFGMFISVLFRYLSKR